MNRFKLVLLVGGLFPVASLIAPAAAAGDKPRIHVSSSHVHGGHHRVRHDRRYDRWHHRRHHDYRRSGGTAVYLNLSDRHHGYSASRGYGGSTVYRSRTVRNDRVEQSYEYAPVVHVEPIVRYVTVRVPERECWEEEIPVRRAYYDGHDDYDHDHHDRRSRRGSAGATIAGTLLGGAIGRQFGGGSGRDAATIAGALIGAAIGRDSGRHDDHHGEGHHRDAPREEVYTEEIRIVERCETRRVSREEERIDGYRVTYLYNGKEYTTRTTADPGDEIRVRVSISPERY